MQLRVQKKRVLSLLLTGLAVISGAACGSNNSSLETAGLFVVNATRTGTAKRVLVRENTEVAENTGLIEIAVPSNITAQPANSGRLPVENPSPDQGQAISDAEQELQRTAVEVSRIEPLVSSGAAPQSHLDAARAQYQQAQERVDAVRRNAQNPVVPPKDNNPAQTAPSTAENVIIVRSPVSGNLRVISVRAGQSVKAGEPIATISTTY